MALTLFSFYRSKLWEDFRKLIIQQRTREDGMIYDEITGKPILKKYDIILHHITELTEENVNDFGISLNPDNIQVISFATHNAIHDRFGNRLARDAYLVYGAPLSGKSTWVKQNAQPGDLIVDIDSLWEAVTGLPRYEKPEKLKGVIFQLRDKLYEIIQYRAGKFSSAFIVGGFPLCSERERLCRQLGAQEILIEATKEECMDRLELDPVRKAKGWGKFIEEWFERYSPSEGREG